MNEDAVQALKEAMGSPDWWTNRARLTAREVVRRLAEQGYTVARESEVRTAPRVPEEWEAGAFPYATPQGGTSEVSPRGAVAEAVSGAPNGPATSEVDQQMLAALMADLESSVAAVRDGRQSAEGDAGTEEGTARDASGDQHSPLADEQRESA